MRKATIFLIAIAMSFGLVAQEKSKVKEAGLVFSSLNNFGLNFKSGNEKALWRYSTLFLSGNNTKETGDDYIDEQKSFGVTLAFGREYRKPLTDKLQLAFGGDVIFGFRHHEIVIDPGDNISYSYSREEKQTVYSPGINLVFGFNYLVSDVLRLGIELNPNFTYDFGKSTQSNDYSGENNSELETDISGFRYGLTSNSVRITIAYQF
jgi:hypothetical protein